MTKSNLEPLTRREREIMNAVFSLGNRAAAKGIHARLSDPPDDSSVRVMSARLEEKGYLNHQQDGPRFIYSATPSTASARRSAQRESPEIFFGGSLNQMMTAPVSEAPWSDDELDGLKKEIGRVRKGRKKQPRSPS